MCFHLTAKHLSTCRSSSWSIKRWCERSLSRPLSHYEGFCCCFLRAFSSSSTGTSQKDKVSLADCSILSPESDDRGIEDLRITHMMPEGCSLMSCMSNLNPRSCWKGQLCLPLCTWACPAKPVCCLTGGLSFRQWLFFWMGRFQAPALPFH